MFCHPPEIYFIIFSSFVAGFLVSVQFHVSYHLYVSSSLRLFPFPPTSKTDIRSSSGAPTKGFRCHRLHSNGSLTSFNSAKYYEKSGNAYASKNSQGQKLLAIFSYLGPREVEDDVTPKPPMRASNPLFNLLKSFDRAGFEKGCRVCWCTEVEHLSTHHSRMNPFKLLFKLCFLSPSLSNSIFYKCFQFSSGPIYLVNIVQTWAVAHTNSDILFIRFRMAVYFLSTLVRSFLFLFFPHILYWIVMKLIRLPSIVLFPHSSLLILGFTDKCSTIFCSVDVDGEKSDSRYFFW